MKKKLLILLCAMLFGSLSVVKADILDGWTKMETSVVANPQDYYFIILHTDNSLMLGVTKTCSTDVAGTNNNTSSSTYDFVSYQTASEPAQDLCKVWTIESCTNGSYSTAYILRSLANVDCPTNAGAQQWELKTDGAVHENSAESAAFNIVLSDGYWKLQDATSTSYYWGAWADAAYVNNERVAGNAGGNGQTTAGSFNIYYMSRTTFNQKYQFFGGTDMNHTIVNRDFEYGTATGWSPDETETATLTIKNTATGSHVSTAQSGSYYCYMKSGGWAAAKQTINNLPSGTYSSTIYLCNDINFLFNNTTAESWGDKTPSGSWTAIAVSDQDITSGSTELRIRGWGDNRFADNASLTYVPNYVSEDASAYTHETTTPLKWYSVNIDNAGLYILTCSEATTLRYTTSSNAKPTDATSQTLSAGEKYLLNLSAGTFYFGTSSATQVNLSTDFTYFISNPSFETGYKDNPPTGWTVTVTSGSSTNANSRYKGDNQNAEGKVDGGSGYVLGFGPDGGSIRFSLWTANAGAGSVKQTLTSLPAGNYKLSAYMATSANSTLTLSAGSTYRTIKTANSDANLVEVYFTHASTGNVEIKATCNATWFDADNFKLQSIGELPAELTGVTGDMNATVASNQSSAITTYSGNKTFANLLAAQTTMNAALASVLVYDEIRGIQTSYASKAESLDAEGLAAYETAINTASTGAKSKYSDGAYATAVEAEIAYHDDYVTAVKAQTTDNTDMTETIVNPSFETGNMTGWTNSGFAIKNNDGFADRSGTYFVDQWHVSGDKSIKQTLSGLHQGKYRLTAAAVANADATSTKLYVKVGETETPTTVSTTSGDYIVNFNYDGSSTLEIGFSTTLGNDGWAAVDNFRLTYLETYYATDTDYAALSAAITSAEAHTLGFESGEYAPYNNIERLSELANAKAINQEADNTKEMVNASTNALNDGVWTANDGDVECVYNGDFAIGQGSPAADIQEYGWTRTNGWGQFHSDSDKSSTSNGTSYYNQPGSLQYGNAGYYTMPLKANTIYQLTFKYASWEPSSNNSVTASVLKSGEGMAEVEYEQNATVHTTAGAFVAKTILFVTTTAGDYVLTLANSGNTVITDVSITKAASQTLTLPSETPYAAGTYPSVTLDRTFASTDRWYTLCAPFAFSKDKFAEVKVLNEVVGEGESAHMKFVDAGETVAAGTPCLVKPASEDATLTATDVAMPLATTAQTVTVDGINFIGTFSQVNLTSANSNAWVVSNNNLYNVDSNVTVGAYRAYFTVSDSPVKALSFDFGDATGINTITNGQQPIANGPIYNLAGQRVDGSRFTVNGSGLKTGIYIVNGKKVLVK